MADVILFNPGEPHNVFQGLHGGGLTAIEPPIWPRLIASYLRVKNISAFVVDAEAMGWDATTAARMASHLEPKLVCVVVHGAQPSASTQKMPAAAAAVKALHDRMPEVPVMLIGGHPAALPLKSLQETGADYVCTGEGPVTVYEFMKYGKKAARGLVDREGTWTAPSPNVIDLDHDMPGDCWDLLPLPRYRSYAHHAWTNGFARTPYASIYTSLNCPYHCEFCMISSPFRNGDQLATRKDGVNLYRMWSAKSVMRELEVLVEVYNVKNIRINDEMFVLNPMHVESICRAISERYGDRLNLWSYGRVDCTKEKFLDQMQAAGFKWLCLGIESVSDDVRDGVAKGEYGRKEIVDTVRRVKAHGINIIANYMFGLPNDTFTSMNDTLNLALELKTEYVNMYAAVAFPGSKLWDDKIKDGWTPPSNWLAWSFHSYEHEPLGTKHLLPEEVLAFRDYAFKRYYNDKSYRTYVQAKFGERAITEIDFMLGHELKRRLLDSANARMLAAGVETCE